MPMPAPTLFGSGAAQSNTVGVIVPWPVGHLAGDLGILVLQTTAQPVAAPTGWTEVASSPQSTGTAGAALSVGLNVFYRIAQSSNEPDAAPVDSGDHTYAKIFVVRGAAVLASPINASSGNVQASTTAVSITGLTTTADNCLVMSISARGNDSASANYSSFANASLTDFSENFDSGTTTGTGGGLGIAFGTKATAGVVSATTATGAVASLLANVMIAIQPEPDAISYRGLQPKITWGASFTNTLSIGWPLDSAVTYSNAADGSEYLDLPSGVLDSYITGHRQFLKANVRWIPTADTTVPRICSGWNGSTGFRAFLEWAREGNAFRFYPDKTAGTFYTCYLVEPRQGEPSLEPDMTRTLSMVIRTTDDTVWTGF